MTPLLGQLWERATQIEGEADRFRQAAQQLEAALNKAAEMLDGVQNPRGGAASGREAIPAQQDAVRKRRKRSTAPQDAGDGRPEQARARTLRRIERRRPDLAEQVRKGALKLHLADKQARPTHHLDHAPHLASWPPDVETLQRQLAEVGDQLEVAAEDGLEDLARRERELTAALETAKAQAMAAQANGAG